MLRTFPQYRQLGTDKPTDPPAVFTCSRVRLSILKSHRMQQMCTWYLLDGKNLTQHPQKEHRAYQLFQMHTAWPTRGMVIMQSCPQATVLHLCSKAAFASLLALANVPGADPVVLLEIMDTTDCLWHSVISIAWVDICSWNATAFLRDADGRFAHLRLVSDVLGSVDIIEPLVPISLKLTFHFDPASLARAFETRLHSTHAHR